MATPASAGKRRYSYADLEQIPDDRNRYEIIGGKLFVSPSPSVAHQRVVVSLWSQLHEFAKVHGGEAFVAPLDIKFSDADVAQPDVFFVAAERSAVVEEKCLHGAPSLVIEVLSPSSLDTDPGEKLALYARFGVPEYWIVDPQTQAIVAYADPRADGTYARRATAHSGSMPSLTIAELTLRI